MPLTKIKNEPLLDVIKDENIRKGFIGNRVISALIKELEQGMTTKIFLTGKIFVEGRGQMEYSLRPAEVKRLFNFFRSEDDGTLANRIKHIEMRNCDIKQSDVFNDLPEFPNLTKLILKDNELMDMDFSFAPNLEVLDLRGNFFEELNLNTSTKLQQLLVGNIRALIPPASPSLDLETPAFDKLHRDFAAWIEERKSDSSLNVDPKITFKEAGIGAPYDYTQEGDEPDSSSAESESESESEEEEDEGGRASKRARRTRRPSV